MFGSTSGEHHFLNNGKLFIDSQLANEILAKHECGLEECARVDGFDYNPTSLIPETLHRLFDDKSHSRED